MFIINIIILGLRIKDKKILITLKEKEKIATSLSEKEEKLEGLSLTMLKKLSNISGLNLNIENPIPKWHLILMIDKRDCGSCIKLLISIAEEFCDSTKFKNIKVIGVFKNREKFDVERFIKDYSITFETLYDPNDLINDYINKENIFTPSFLLCDSEFTIISAYCHHTIFPKRLDYFYEKLKRLLKK